MAVLIEAISVVIRGEALLAAFGGDWQRFKTTVPNATLCADGELVRVGFMTPDDAKRYIGTLEAEGLRHLEDDEGTDIVIVEQFQGPLSPCNWIEFGHVSLDGDPQQRVATCRAKGSIVMRIVNPLDWTFESSLSREYGYVPHSGIDKTLEFLRHENGIDVYWNKLTGEEVHVGRTKTDD